MFERLVRVRLICSHRSSAVLTDDRFMFRGFRNAMGGARGCHFGATGYELRMKPCSLSLRDIEQPAKWQTLPTLRVTSSSQSLIASVEKRRPRDRGCLDRRNLNRCPAGKRKLLDVSVDRLVEYSTGTLRVCQGVSFDKAMGLEVMGIVRPINPINPRV